MRVLIVEDHQDGREQLDRGLIRRDGVATAGDLRAALDLWETRRFDAIIADIAFPEDTNHELISEVRQQAIQSVNIALSGHPYPPDNEAGATGFHHYLSTPVNCDHSVLSLAAYTRTL